MTEERKPSEIPYLHVRAPQMSKEEAKMHTLERLKVQKVLAALTVAAGLVLMAGKIYADSEPGAIPMLLVVLGTGWYLVTRARTRSPRR